MEKQEKLYHLYYESKMDKYEEIFKESELLKVNGPIRFCEEHCQIGKLSDLIKERICDYLDNYANTLKDMKGDFEWIVDDYKSKVGNKFIDYPLGNISAVSWMDKFGMDHFVIGTDPFRLVQDVFNEIDKGEHILEIKEITPEQAKAITNGHKDVKLKKQDTLGR